MFKINNPAAIRKERVIIIMKRTSLDRKQAEQIVMLYERDEFMDECFEEFA